jgi:hypothetical protein
MPINQQFDTLVMVLDPNTTITGVLEPNPIAQTLQFKGSWSLTLILTILGSPQCSP